MKIIKLLLVWFGMILMAVFTPVLHLLRYEVSIEANRNSKK